MLVISLDIAVKNVSKNIGHIMNCCAKNGRLNYETRFYSGNPNAVIVGTVRFVFFCRCQLTKRKNHHCMLAAAQQYAVDVYTPIRNASGKRSCNLRVHFVETSYQIPMKKPTRMQ